MVIRRIFVLCMFLLGGLCVPAATYAEDAGGKQAEPPAAPVSPYFLHVIPEGEKARPPDLKREQESAAVNARVLSTLAAMKHVGLYATYLIAMLAAAGAAGAVLAFLVSLFKERRTTPSARR